MVGAPIFPGFTRHELGLLVPGVDRPRQPGVPGARVYLSYRDLAGGPRLSEDDVVQRLVKLSAADCLLAIAHLNTRLFAQTRPDMSAPLQYELLTEALADGDIRNALVAKLRVAEDTVVFHEQQLVHLARLVVLHADHRPSDEFGGGALAEDWAMCLIGVNDLLDVNLDLEDPDERLSWEIRQCTLNQHEDQLPVTAIHYEVYRVVWPAMKKARVELIEEAFRRHTKMSIGDYFTVGNATLARLTMRGACEPTVRPAIEPAQYFSSARIDDTAWQAFFAVNARDLTRLRDELLREVNTDGADTYSSLTFERFPLVEIKSGLFSPVSMYSLQRRVSQGVFHLLSEAAAAEGHDRRRYSSRFGRVFQASVEQTLRRGVAYEARPASITADISYGPRSQRVDSTDVILGYERNPVFIEVVSGPLKAATIMRGELTSFHEDVDRLIVGKTRQLDENIARFFAGDLALPGVDPATVAHVWPVIVTSYPFPHRDQVLAAMGDRIRDRGYLQQVHVEGLAILSAEELFFCEGFMQRGRSFLALIRGWKSGNMATLPLKNYLIELGGGQAPASDHFVRRFAEANAETMQRVLGETPAPGPS